MRRFALPPLIMTAVLVAFAAACRGRDTRRVTPPAPAAEFLVVSGPATVWVKSGEGGVRLRSSPLLLARFGGRFYEVYVADDDRSYYDAVFVGQRVYRRDLVSGDSSLVYEDGVVAAAAARYAAAHDGEAPLGPEEDGSENPSSQVTAEVELLEVWGPFASFEEHLDLEGAGESDRHETRRGVIDLRSGRRASIADVAPDTAGRRVLRAGRATFSAALDSVLATGDPRAREAAGALADFEFDPASFTVGAAGGRPVVAFFAPGRRGAAVGLGLPLAAVPLGTPRWWKEIGDALPDASGDSLVVRWPRRGYAVEARLDSAGEGASLALRDSTGRVWEGGSIPAAPSQVYWLDPAVVDSTTRRALARAFDEAALYSEEARTASYRVPGTRNQEPGNYPGTWVKAGRGPGVLKPVPVPVPFFPGSRGSYPVPGTRYPVPPRALPT
ncbi:MAG TPA: hypothetical protein VNA89_01340 [Gemmatimonadaceae bacterium]|nr:hypothetical protein [Gemmatimonadaceae bacterium]